MLDSLVSFIQPAYNSQLGHFLAKCSTYNHPVNGSDSGNYSSYFENSIFSNNDMAEDLYLGVNEDNLFIKRILLVGLRCLFVFASLWNVCADLKNWTSTTVTSLILVRRGWRHIADLTAIITTICLSILMMPFGYTPAALISRRKSFLGVMNDKESNERIVRVFLRYGKGAVAAKKILELGYHKGTSESIERVRFLDHINNSYLVLRLAAEQEDVEALEVFVKEGKIDVNIGKKGNHNDSDTFRNAVFKSPVVTEALLRLGADPNKEIFCNYPIEYPLVAACQGEKDEVALQVVQLLIKYRADPNVCSNNARINNFDKSRSIFAIYGTGFTIPWTPLVNAFLSSNEQTALYLIQVGADLTPLKSVSHLMTGYRLALFNKLEAQECILRKENIKRLAQGLIDSSLGSPGQAKHYQDDVKE